MAVEAPNGLDQLKEITECCICTDIYTNPKLLPCAHTFCLSCLQRLGRDKRPGDEMACPVCRKEFSVPSKGIAALPSNFFMRNLVEISGHHHHPHRSSLTERESAGKRGGRKASCDQCTRTLRSSVTEAKVRCADCQVNLCDDCARRHSASARTKAHRIAAIAGSSHPAGHHRDTDELLRLKAGVTCVLHPARKIRMYCLDCRMSVCMMCYSESHRSHRCSNVGNFSRDIRRQLQGEVEHMTVRMAELKDRLARLQGEKAVIGRQVRNAENSIARRGAEVKAIVDRHVQDLVEELGRVRTRKTKEVEVEIEGLQRHVTSFAGCQSRIKVVREQARTGGEGGGGLDVLKEVKDVETLIDQLEETFLKKTYFPIHIAFKATDLDELLKGELTNLVGATEVRLNTNDRRANGVASIDNRWFVVCWQTTAVLVFDSRDPFPRLPDLHVPRLKSARDIAACHRSHCLYVTDGTNCVVWRVTLHDPPITTRWLAGLGEPFTLSVTPRGRVVTLAEAHPHHALDVFAPDATLLRRIHLPDAMDSPQHALETTSSVAGAVRLLVCHGWATVRHQRVCELSREGGTVTRSYPASDAAGHVLNRPCHLAEDGEGRVFVADSLNHRVILLDAQLRLDQVLMTREHEDLYQPSRLCYDRNSGQLLVGHKKGVDVYSWT